MGKSQKYKKAQQEKEIEPEDFASTDEEFGGFESEHSQQSEQEAASDSDSSEDEAPQPKTKAEKMSKLPIKEKAKTGVVYVGRIPHGFDEKGMRKYFSQFGDILNLRLSRNKKTGNSKHYGFIEFQTPEIADIVCDTMDGYLLFGHVLKCKRVEQVHSSMWTGANKKFSQIPWSQIGKRRYDRKHTREWWEEHQKADVARRLQRSKELKKLGIDYSY